MNITNGLLINSDNIKGLNYLLNERDLRGKIDLVYIDPPFATGTTFTITDGRASTISNSQKGTTAYEDNLKGTDFIEFLRERLLLIRELLSESGSIYLHIDYKIGHYVKVMMDEVFGINNFRSDISRIKCNPKNFSRVGYGNIKDMILFYSKSKSPIWNESKTTYTKSDIERLFKKIDEDGRRYTTVPIHAPGESKSKPKLFRGLEPPAGRHWRTDVKTMEDWDDIGLIEWSKNGNPRKKIFADEKEGMKRQDIWEFKDPQYPNYPTEKNPKLLDVIINASSQKDSIVLDCFCGSGTTLLSAIQNGRKFIGIDQSAEAIKATLTKLDQTDSLSEGFEVVNIE